MNVQTGACGNGGDGEDDEEGEAADMEGSPEFLFIYIVPFYWHKLLAGSFDFNTSVGISEYEESGLLETDDVSEYT